MIHRMGEDFIREIVYYENFYLDFFKALKPEVQKKFNWTLQLIATVERVPEKYFKHMTNTDGIYEVRVEYASSIYRVFAFFDKGNLVVLANGFQKKTQKTPKKELKLAEKLKHQYLKQKYGK